jgi:hypothetical protein
MKSEYLTRKKAIKSSKGHFARRAVSCSRCLCALANVSLAGRFTFSGRAAGVPDFSLGAIAMSEVQNKIVAVIGRKGSGKSTRVATMLRHCPQIFVWDPMRDHLRTVRDYVEAANSYKGENSLLDRYFIEAGRTKAFALAYIPEGDLEEEFEEICQFVYHYGHMLFVVEEAPLVLKAGYMPPTFGKIVRTGRHRGIDLLWTAQRAAEVSRTLTSMTDVFIFYSQTEPRDLDAIGERCGREVADQVAGLGLHDSFTWDVIDRKIVEDSPRLLKREVSG